MAMSMLPSLLTSPNATPRRHASGICQPGGRGDILECAVPRVAEQLHWLAVFRPAGDCVHLRIHVSVRDENVQPAVVVKVYKSSSPLHVGITGLGSLRCPANVCETLNAQVTI